MHLSPVKGLGWSDVGSWDSWASYLQSHVVDEEGESRGAASSNVSQGDVVFIESNDCFVLGNKKLVASVGLKNVVIVETDDALPRLCQGALPRCQKSCGDTYEKSARGVTIMKPSWEWEFFMGTALI